MIAIILAGGFGTRLRSILPELPKPMAPVAGRPFLEHLLDYWMAQGCREFVLSVGYRAEMIMDHFGQNYKGCPIHFVIEKEPLGTGGALFAALKNCDPKGHDRVLAMNGDTFFAADLEQLKAFDSAAAADLTLALLPARSESRYGRVQTDSKGRVLAFASAGAEGGWINAGLYLLNAGWMRDQACHFSESCSLEGELFPAWLQQGCGLAGWRTEAPFLDIGLPESYALAGDFIRQIHGNE